MAKEKLTRYKFVKWGTKAQESQNTTPQPLKSFFFYLEDENDLDYLIHPDVKKIVIEKHGKD